MKCLTFSRFVLVWLLVLGGVVHGLGQTPTITSISPTSGAQGTDITLNVANLTAVPGAANRVVFLTASTATGTTFYSASLVLPSSPYTGSLTLSDFRNSSMSSFTGTVSIFIQDANARTNNVSFTVTAPPVPTITSFTPSTAPAGSTITITGTNFTGATAVRISGVPVASFTVVSPTQITVTLPANAASGLISVTTPNGTATSANAFTLLIPAPTITSFTPSMGPVGTRIMVTGTNFRNAADEGVIQSASIGGVDAPLFGTQSGTQMAVVVPSGARTGRIVVVTSGGTATSSTDFTVQTGSGVPLGFTELPVRVFPSPAESMLTIETSLQAASVVQVQIVSASGTTLLTRESRVNAGAYHTSLDVSNLTAGVYFVRVQAGSAAWVEKIVKQ